jgi:hypothetical protein
MAKTSGAKSRSKAKKGRGRPTVYRPEFVDQVRKLCRLGAADAELADFFGVNVLTVHRWKKTHPDFCNALKDGKQLADAEVADKLFRRATGFSHPDVHISNYQGEVTVTNITKHYPPDTVACIFWLKNRRPDLWRERIDPAQDGGELPEAKSFTFTIVDGRKKTANADAD